MVGETRKGRKYIINWSNAEAILGCTFLKLSFQAPEYLKLNKRELKRLNQALKSV